MAGRREERGAARRGSRGVRGGAARRRAGRGGEGGDGSNGAGRGRGEFERGAGREVAWRRRCEWDRQRRGGARSGVVAEAAQRGAKAAGACAGRLAGDGFTVARRARHLMGGGVGGTEARPFVQNRSALHTAACSTSHRIIDAYTMVCVVAMLTPCH